MNSAFFGIASIAQSGEGYDFFDEVNFDRIKMIVLFLQKNGHTGNCSLLDS